MNKNALDPAWIESQLAAAQWQSASSGSQTCVEIAFLDQGIVALRDSKTPEKPAHLFTDAEYDAFIDGIMRGELRRC
ncbi:DUF397 domain-containing protein [Streptomyces europaeiscabiei]|uniref:DUF397 domain-containing protein n=1 Tax=Streptomyces europaeiscabiei TaxID=146819 RepID=UPI0029A75639|nr:DUF397 domain-containing protein [Streptomyces europaeiscabiei]MDX2757324.1 DUF397 domain-containing protein [Streptomyces europaeiscabiei]